MAMGITLYGYYYPPRGPTFWPDEAINGSRNNEAVNVYLTSVKNSSFVNKISNQSSAAAFNSI